jgi:hypothetical protein
MKEKPKDNIRNIALPQDLISRIKLHCCIKGEFIRHWAVRVLEAALNKEGK